MQFTAIKSNQSILFGLCFWSALLCCRILWLSWTYFSASDLSNLQQATVKRQPHKHIIASSPKFFPFDMHIWLSQCEGIYVGLHIEICQTVIHEAVRRFVRPDSINHIE